MPTAERDGAIGLSIFGPMFRGVRALMYNSFEERAMIQAVSGNTRRAARRRRHRLRGAGAHEPGAVPPEVRHHGPFVVYVGRIDENKGCKELFDFFERYTRAVRGELTLVLMGNSILPIPDHPRIRHLGFVSDEDKFDGIAAADALIMPSYFESLSMVALEAWALGRPVLANGRCDVLQGQCLRSNAGLFYENARGVRRDAGAARSRTAALARRARRRTAARTSSATTRGRSSSASTWTCSSGCADDDQGGAARPPLEPLPGWFARRRGRLPRRRTTSCRACRPGPRRRAGSGAR